MSSLKRNILANLVGGVWIAVLTLAITPLQINLLGISAYGIIGFISTLQIIVSVLDFGLSSTITRELAGDHSPQRIDSQPLLRTAITFYWSIAALIWIALGAFAGDITAFWFKTQGAEAALLTNAMAVIAMFLALRWPVALYTGILAGLQRMDVLNLLKAGSASVRLIGGMIVLLIWRDLKEFLVWFGVSALLEVLAYDLVCRKMLPRGGIRPGFSTAAVGAVWAFSLNMNGLALLGMGLTQLDRLFISRMLPLSELGYYSLAYSAATSISLILSALSTALMPSFASAYAAGTKEVLLRRYDAANRLTLFATAVPLFALIFFGEPLLRLWVSSSAAAGAWRPLIFLAGGFWLSAAVSNAYNVSVACREPGPMLRISALSAVFYAPALYVFTEQWGILGASVSWLLLNFGYVLTIVPSVHRRLLSISVSGWFTRTLLPFMALGTATFGGSRLVAVAIGSTPVSDFLMLSIAVIAFCGIGYFLLGRTLRAEFGQLVDRIVGIPST